MQFKTSFSAALAVAVASGQSLTDLLSGNENLTALTTLLGAYPDLTASLGSATNVTLFAPNNDAISALNESGALTAASSMPGAVEALLSYHVLPSLVYASQIMETPAFPPTLLNDTMYTNVTGGQVVEAMIMDGAAMLHSGLGMESNIVQVDQNYTGGVVHVIDQVLTVPVSVSQTALAANLTALAGALTATDLLSTVDGLADVTIFAPSNDAFAAIASATGSLSTDQLAAILEYHVINGTVAYSSTLSNTTVPTLAGGEVTISVIDGEVFVNSARVIIPDVLVAGGVVHVIDSVLNPNNTSAMPTPSATAGMPAYSGASSGTAVPFTSGVPSATMTASELTMPTSAMGSAGGAMSSASASGSMSAQTGAASMPTAAIGAAALFGGAALVGNW